MLDLTKLPIGTRLRTRDGRSARLLATDIVDVLHTCAVAVQIGDSGEMIETVQPTGHLGYLDEAQPSDIVGIDKPKHRVRVVVWSTMVGTPTVTSFHETQPGFSDERDEFFPHRSVIIADQIVEIEETGDVP